MKPIAAIVESSLEACSAAFRTSYSEWRELGVQVEKADKRASDATRIAETARGAREDKRIEVGRHLAEVHRAMGVKQGERSGRWAKFLAQEGLAEETARRWIAEVGSYDAATSPNPKNGGSARSGSSPAPEPEAREPLRKVLDMQLYLGRWEDILADAGMVDVLITDPPYSERVHRSAPTRSDDSDPDGLTPNYAPWSAEDVHAFVEHWSPRTRGWMLCLCDDELIPVYRAAYERMGRVAFAPVPCLITGMSVRTRGDGPSSWAVYAMVARPHGDFARWGTTPGGYHGPKEVGAKHGRGKPTWLLDAFVRDYSRGNDLVCDPLAGYGGTLVAALKQNRRAIGAEQDEKAIEEAFARASASKAVTTADDTAPTTETP